MLDDKDIRRIFSAVTGAFLVVKPDACFTIVCASPDYLRATGTDASIAGRGLFEVLPGSPARPNPDGVEQLRASLLQVLATGQAQTMPAQRHDVRLPVGDGFEARDRVTVNTPVLTEDGAVDYIVHRLEEAPAKDHQDQEKLQAEQERLVVESEMQRRIYETALNSTPDFVYVFDVDHRALYANDALLRTWGVADVRGKRWMDLGYAQWHADLHDRELAQVIATGAPIRGEIPFTGTGGTRMYDYIFAPVLDADGQVVAVAGTTRDITERQAAEQAARDQAERLAQADRVKDEFLATLSHELRNPLVPLRNGIELLRRFGNADERATRVFAMMERQITQLVRLVEDLLEMSRISRGTLSLQMERVALADVIRNAVETSDPLIQKAGHRLEVLLPADPLWVEGDPVRLTQILANLLNNAAKFTDSGGHIELRAWSEGAEAIVSITDNGIGIDAALQPRLFEMFMRGNRETARSQTGLGIGLALSRKLATMHGGHLEMYSAGVDAGSRFTFRMPLAPAAGIEEAPEAGESASLSKLRVLVIEDNREVAQSLAMVLDLLGAEVQVACGGPQGLEAFAAWCPAVVLLDIGMPMMNGYEVAEAIRTRFPAHGATLVAMTGWGREEDRHRALAAGFDHHLVKPASMEVLGRLLKSIEERGRRA